MTAGSADIAAAFTAACRDELDAPKPGNVHHFAPGRRKTAADFVRSAEAAAPGLAAPGARVGARILAAVEATSAAVGSNTNLGIILLCAPLAAAAEARPAGLRDALAGVLDTLDVADAALAFRAIVLASPGGLGRADRHDVSEPASVTLRQAMAEAANRDRIAHQYVTGFKDVLDRSDGLLARTLSRWSDDPKWATLAVYLDFLSAYPDSHVVREHGIAAADEVRRIASAFHRRLLAAERPAALLGDLIAWDKVLKDHGLNPGTSADLTVATLFAHRLTNSLPSAPNSG